MPLRKLAASLDIDTSTLSKIERRQRHLKPYLLPFLSEALNLDFDKLQIIYWSDRMFDEMGSKEKVIRLINGIKSYVEK